MQGLEARRDYSGIWAVQVGIRVAMRRQRGGKGGGRGGSEEAERRHDSRMPRLYTKWAEVHMHDAALCVSYYHHPYNIIVKKETMLVGASV